MKPVGVILFSLLALTIAARDVSRVRAGDMDDWLAEPPPARAPTPPPSTQPAESPLDTRENFRRPDAVPGVLVLSDGRMLPGHLYTTRGAAWNVYVEEQKLWRRVPFEALLSISAVVTEEKMEQKWRWKSMGTPERVYTGESYPTRRMLWRFRLADGSEIVGAVKGQPVSVALGQTVAGPFVLHERQAGPPGQTLDQLLYVRKVIVSARALREVLAQAPQTQPTASAPRP